MKKKLFLSVIGLVAASFVTTGVAFAADPVAVSKDGDKVTVAVSTLDSNEETTLLVVGEGVSIAEAFADTGKIFHMDQLAADGKGVATFNFTYNGEGSLTIYSGYATMSDTEKPYEGLLDLSGGTGGGSGGEDILYGDVNADEMVDTMDAIEIIDNFLHGAELAVYEAADVNVDEMVDTMDALAIINNFLYGTEFDANLQ